MGLATYLLGIPSELRSRTFIAPGTNDERQQRHGLYIQDQWRVTPRFTLNYGIRYALFSPTYSPLSPGGAQYDFDLAVQKIANVGDVSSTSNVRWDKNNWGPRLGFAYRLTDKFVLRGGYGRTFSTGVGGENIGVFGFVWPVAANIDNLGADDAFQGLPPFSVGPPPIDIDVEIDPSGLMRQPSNQLVYGVREDNPIPEIHSWNLTLQHEFAPNWTWEVSHVGNRGINLWTNVDRNGAPPGPGSFRLRQPYNVQYGIRAAVTDRSNEARSSYYSFQGSLRKRFSNGFSFGHAFTWGKGLDTSWIFPVDNFCRECSKSVSDFDAAVVYRFWHIFELPFGAGKQIGGNVTGFLDHIIGGWQWSGILSARSGFPFTPELQNQSNYNARWSRETRLLPDRIGDGKLDNPTEQRWFDTSAYVFPADYTQGNTARNSLRGPSMFGYDVDFSKSFHLREDTRLKFRVSIFNAFNVSNLAMPNDFVDNAGAGEITNIAMPMRQLEFGVAIIF